MVARKNSTLLRYVNPAVQNILPTDKKEYDFKNIFVSIVVNRN
jgi:hypothetical protein